MKPYTSVIVIVFLGILVLTGGGLFYYFTFVRAGLPNFLRIATIVATGALIVALIKVGVDRIHEIRKGDEDDIGKY